MDWIAASSCLPLLAPLRRTVLVAVLAEPLEAFLEPQVAPLKEEAVPLPQLPALDRMLQAPALAPAQAAAEGALLQARTSHPAGCSSTSD